MNMKQKKKQYNYLALLLTAFIVGCFSTTAHSQQVPDMDFQFNNTAPKFADGNGPILLLEAVHSPFVQRGSFDPLLKLAKEDGFQPGYLNYKITANSLEKLQILAIINSYRQDYTAFSAMEPPSAYEDSEIIAINEWVKNGGRLLLIADHAPFSGGTSKLAESFGFTFFNSFVLETSSLPFRNGAIKYDLSYGLNENSPIIAGQHANKKIERFMIFTGSAFIAPVNAISVLNIPNGFSALIMKSNQQDIGSVPQINVSGLSQGATMEVGKGRIAVFAEAASFSAQIINKIKLHGMNNPRADQNALFVLATLRWLAEGL